MGMPCQVNSILKLKVNRGYPELLEVGRTYHAQKDSYRIFPIDVPIPLVDDRWIAHADVVITKLTWQQGNTDLEFRIDRVYRAPFSLKEQ